MSKKQPTEITVEKFHELVNKQISKLETKIDRTYEKYPGLKADNMVDPIRDDIRRLKELKKGVQSAEALRAELERTKWEKSQLEGALAETLNAISKYDPWWVLKIKKRWKV